MNYRALSDSLHGVANKAIVYFRTNHGVKNVRIEEALGRDIEYAPTFFADMTDQHILTVDVTDGGYTESLNSYVLTCRNKVFPVRHYIAYPASTEGTKFKQLVVKAKENGLGLLEVGDHECKIMSPALSLSLVGVRPVEASQFPSKYRQALTEAHQVFLNGDPAKACAKIYDEIELLTRHLAIKIDKKNWWIDPKGGALPAMNYEIVAWKMLLDRIREYADFKALKEAKCDLRDTHVAAVIGITPHRNETGHKPKNQKALAARDRELRTRFESAVDMLRDLADRTKSLRL